MFLSLLVFHLVNLTILTIYDSLLTLTWCPICCNWYSYSLLGDILADLTLGC